MISLVLNSALPGVGQRQLPLGWVEVRAGKGNAADPRGRSPAQRSCFLLALPSARTCAPWGPHTASIRRRGRVGLVRVFPAASGPARAPLAEER